MTTTPAKSHRVVIVGAGFGGLEATFGLAGAGVEITLIDRRNHHLFQPLLYQVATTSLGPPEIAWPVVAPRACSGRSCVPGPGCCSDAGAADVASARCS